MTTIYKITFDNYQGENFIELYHKEENARARYQELMEEGKKHQVKRMIRYAGCRVVYLKREKIGELSLDKSLLPGEYRAITEEELLLLKG